MKSMTSTKDEKSQIQAKSASYDCMKANSCVELAEIRKLDSLLNQCESLSCDNLLQHQEVFYYESCSTTQRKYASTSALHKIYSNKTIRAKKKIIGIREDDRKIFKPIRNERYRETSELETKCCSLCEIKHIDKEMTTSQSCINSEKKKNNESMTKTLGCSKCYVFTKFSTNIVKNRCKNSERKHCDCQNNENENFMCETSLTTSNVCNTDEHMKPSSLSSTLNRKLSKKALFKMRKELSDETVKEISCNVRKNSTIVDSLEASIPGSNIFSAKFNVISVNDIDDKLVNICPNSSYSLSRGSSKINQHDIKSEKSESQSQRAKRSKFWKFNSEDDGAGGVKESLLKRSKSAEKKLPEQVETVSSCFHLCVFISFFHILRFKGFIVD